MKKLISITILVIVIAITAVFSNCITVLADEANGEQTTIEAADDTSEEVECTHNWNEGKIIKNPSCKDTGIKAYTCTVCGEVRNETIAKTTTHNYKNVVTKATPKANGKIVPTCSVCGTKKTATVIYYPKTITLSAKSYTYDGKTKKPSVTVKDSRGKKLSTKNYTVTYAKGRKNVGKYAVKITFKGNYSGSVTRYFTINPKISLSAKSYTYDGKVKKPSVTVKTGKNNNFNKKYYTVSYSKGRKNVGKYKVTIKFKNGHSGTYTREFTIKPRVSQITSLKSGAGQFVIKWKPQKTSQVSGYQIAWSADSKFRSTEIITMSKNSYSAKKVTGLDKRTYYVKIRTYKTVKIDGKSKKIYSSWSKPKSIYIKSLAPAAKKESSAPKKNVTPQEVQKQVNDYIKSRNGYCGVEVTLDPTLRPDFAGWSYPLSAKQQYLNDGTALKNCKELVDSEIEEEARGNYEVYKRSLYCYYDDDTFYICYL